ncbi:MAG: GTP-sensing pleiotropic transcriptional regulator CodY [Bacillota bacterium]
MSTLKRLLEQTRKLNRLLQNSAREKIEFVQLTDVLSDSLKCNAYLFDRKGQMLGYSLSAGFSCDKLKDVIETYSVPPEMNEWLMSIWETRALDQTRSKQCLLSNEDCEYDMYHLIMPIGGGGQRLGTFILARSGKAFEEDDIVLGEYAAMVTGMMLFVEKSGRVEEEARKRAAVQIATSTLSYSEIEALQHIFDELGGDEGLLVASKIADEVGITRSVIVNALRKLESAGVLESRSLGMKGTYIRVLNDMLISEVRKAH